MRSRIEAAIDALVREHRFTIAIVFPLVGAVLLIASAEAVLPPPFAFHPGLLLVGIVVLRLPLLAGMAPLLDRRANVVLLALTGYAYGIGYIGLTTGWPYGAFSYNIGLGPMIAGVPIGLPVFFFPLVVNSYLLVLLLGGDRTDTWLYRIAGTLGVVLLVDLVLDPGAVAVQFWTYHGQEVYYGVPLSNYAGWVLSGTIAVLAFDQAFDRTVVRRRLAECEFMLDDLVSFVLLWGAINAYYSQWVPVGLAAVIGIGLVRANRFDFAVGGRRFAASR
jgi:putative membrane protein